MESYWRVIGEFTVGRTFDWQLSLFSLLPGCAIQSFTKANYVSFYSSLYKMAYFAYNSVSTNQRLASPIWPRWRNSVSPWLWNKPHSFHEFSKVISVIIMCWLSDALQFSCWHHIISYVTVVIGFLNFHAQLLSDVDIFWVMVVARVKMWNEFYASSVSYFYVNKSL